MTTDRQHLTIASVNATESEQKIDLNVTGERVAGPSTLWQMTGSSLDAANHVGQPPQVEVKEIPINGALRAILLRQSASAFFSSLSLRRRNKD